MSLSVIELVLHPTIVPKLYNDVVTFVTDIKTLESNANVKAAMGADPSLQTDINELSVPWRTLEGDEISLVRDKNIGSKLHDLAKGSGDFNRLAQAFHNVLADPALRTYITSKGDPAITALVAVYGDIVSAFSLLGLTLPAL